MAEEVLVCREGEIADGDVRLIRVGPVEIGVIRHKGSYYAYRSTYLGQRFDEDDMHLVCPWHGYEFHLSDGCHVVDRRVRLKKYNVVQRNGEIYIAV
jgi:nitrite reductase (NADH) small subunit